MELGEIKVNLSYKVIGEYNDIYTIAYFMNDTWIGIIAIDTK